MAGESTMMGKNLKYIGTTISIKIQYLHSHLDSFPVNMHDYRTRGTVPSKYQDTLQSLDQQYIITKKMFSSTYLYLYK